MQSRHSFKPLKPQIWKRKMIHFIVQINKKRKKDGDNQQFSPESFQIITGRE